MRHCAHDGMRSECAFCFAASLPEFFGACDWGCECGPGWFPLLRWLAEVKPPTVTVTQVKEKFGGLRVYFDGDDPGGVFERAVSVAEARALLTCETCGKPGLRRGTGWLYTSCEEHVR